MLNTKIAIVSAALLIGPVASAAEAPAWCKGAKERVDSTSLDLKDLAKETDARDALRTIVAASCFPDGEAREAAKEVAAARDAWSKKLRLSEADWTDVAEWASTGAELDPSLAPREGKVAISAWSPMDQYVGIYKSSVGFSDAVTDPAYVADAIGARISQAGRLAYVRLCVEGSNATPVEWAMCQADIDAFDAEKLSAELRGDTTRDGSIRTALRIAAFHLGPKLVEHAAKVKALRAKDPGYDEMWKLAEKAQKDFGGVDAKLVELMGSVDDARVTRSRKAAAGCVERAWQAWKGVAASTPAKSFAALASSDPTEKFWFLPSALGIVTGTPNGYLASMALNTCASLEDKHDYLTRSLGSAIQYLPGYRGPRTATHTAILTAKITLDDRDAKIDYPDLNRPWVQPSTGSNGGGMGTIANVTTAGDKVTIEFAKVKSKQQECTKGKYTNRITQIRSDGTLVYEYICLASKTVTIDEPPFKAQTVNARYAGGLKKGMFVTVIEDVVVVGYGKSGDATPTIVAGVAVK